jgi:hypothetical protein
VFADGCAQPACHSGPGIAGLSFDDARQAYDHLLEATPTNGSAVQLDLRLVEPGDPARSFLLTKMELPQAELGSRGFGGPMPQAAVQIPGPQSLQAIRDWIEAGAPFEGSAIEPDYIEAEGGYVLCDATDPAGLEACFGEAPDPSKTLRLYTPPMTIPAGQEVLLCINLPYIAERDLLFKSVRGGQMKGGHHAGVFVSVQPSEDFAPAECGDDMSHLRYTAGAGGGGGGFTELPQGVALRIANGQQIVIQSHYINTSDQPITVMDMVELDYTTIEESPTVVDAFAIIHDDIAIPPGAVEHEEITECKLDEDFDIYMMLGHTHEYGVFFQLERVPGDGSEPELLYHATDGKLLRESPEIKLFDTPLRWSAGDTIRITCRWTNDTDHEIGWPEEMCVALMYYGPGRGWLTCNQDSGTPQGGEDPGEGCVAADTPGNGVGVGRACTAGGGECSGNGKATVCLGDFDARANFCSMFGCESDADCGDGAICSDQGAAKVCIPNACT